MATKTNDSYYLPVTFGRPLKYTPDELRQEFVKYVQWCMDHPIVIKSKQKGRNKRGAWSSETVDEKPRLVSVEGFMVFLGASLRWWGELSDGKHGEEFSVVKAVIKQYCEDYQKAMASTGVFKENIISRLLGLADKKAIDASEGVTIVVKSEEEAEKIKNIGNLKI